MKKTFLVVLLVVLSLALGVIVGLGLGRKASHRLGYPRSNGLMDAKGPVGTVDRVSQRLNLTEEQKEKIKKILENSREELNQERNALTEKFKEIREKTDTKIRSTLTPEQEKEFDSMVAELKARFEKSKELSGNKN